MTRFAELHMTKEEFHHLFERLYSPLCAYAHKILSSHDDSQDIVQSVFVEFWNKENKDQIGSTYDNYLIRAVKYKCIDYQRRILVKRKYEAEALHTSVAEQPGNEEELNLGEVLQVVISQLPEKTREVFILCKQEGLSYKDIAQKLDISVKTVENQMGRAFRHLRENLKQYKGLEFLIILIQGVGVFDIITTFS